MHPHSEENDVASNMHENDAIGLLHDMMDEPWWEFLDEAIEHVENIHADEATADIATEDTFVNADDVTHYHVNPADGDTDDELAFSDPGTPNSITPRTWADLQTFVLQQMAGVAVPETVFDDDVNEIATNLAAKITAETIAEITATAATNTATEETAPKTTTTAHQVASPEIPTPQTQAATRMVAPRMDAPNVATPTIATPAIANPAIPKKAKTERAKRNAEAGVNHAKVEGYVDHNGMFWCFCGAGPITNNSSLISSHVSRQHRGKYTRAEMEL